MSKKFAVFALIIAVVISIAAVGCGKKSSSNQTTPPPASQETVAPTAGTTEEPDQPSELPGNYKFLMEWSDSTGNSGEMQFWVKGDKWRTDWSATQDGTESELLMIYDGQFAYMYMPAMNQVFKYTNSDDLGNPGAAYAQDFEDSYWGEVSDATILAAFEAACIGGASFDGHEDVNGISCMKFTCNFVEDGVSHYWIADSGWLVKVETTLEGVTTTMQYSNIEFNADIDDSIFDINTVASGVPITEI